MNSAISPETVKKYGRQMIEVLGFPGTILPEIARHLKLHQQKAMPRSRAKTALATLQGDREKKTASPFEASREVPRLRDEMIDVNEEHD